MTTTFTEMVHDVQDLVADGDKLVWRKTISAKAHGRLSRHRADRQVGVVWLTRHLACP